MARGLGQETKNYAEDCGKIQTPAGSLGQYNQVESLQKQNEELRGMLEIQRTELLELYRRIYQADRPAGHY